MALRCCSSVRVIPASRQQASPRAIRFGGGAAVGSLAPALDPELAGGGSDWVCWARSVAGATSATMAKAQVIILDRSFKVHLRKLLRMHPADALEKPPRRPEVVEAPRLFPDSKSQLPAGNTGRIGQLIA